MRTPKYEKQAPFLAGMVTIWQELFLLGSLITAMVFMYSMENFHNLSGKLWISVLGVQAVPYLASLIILLVSIAPHYLSGEQNVDNEENIL